MIPPSSSSDGTARSPGTGPDSGPQQETEPGLGALVARLAEEFGADAETVAAVASVFRDVRDRAPDLFVPGAGALAAALAAAADARGAQAVYAALGEWALDAEAEPIARMRRDCLRFLGAMTRGALRLHAGDAERCAQSLAALQRFTFLQLGLLASLAARVQEGGVVRTLPTPEYAAFMEIFRTTIESHRQEGRQLGLLLLRIGRVEQLDGLLGLQRGEAFMLRVTRRMREGVLRRQDQLGRVSRDELACLLPRIAGEGVAILAANKLLGALEAPIQIGDHSFAPDAAIGIALYPEHGADPQTLVRHGKLAARAARASPERVAIYDAAQGESEERRVRYEARLRDALEANALGLAFAPRLDLRSGALCGLQCVLRWTDAGLGDVPEADAVAAAEAAGVERELMWWIFNNALRQCADLARAGLLLPIGIRVTASGLRQPDFAEFVGRSLDTWGVRPDQALLEIGETALAGDADQAMETLERLKARGVRLGIGDFGSGAASLGTLARLPLDQVTLSAVLVRELPRGGVHERIVRSLVHLAQDLGLGVAADGVEDGEIARALGALGCERVQGAYAGPALGAAEILAKYSPRPGR